MQEEDRDTKSELPVDSSRRKLALALLGGFAGASLLEACEEAEPEALKAAGPLAELNEAQQGQLTTSAYDTATELTTHLGEDDPLLVSVAGLNVPGDGRGGQFYWDPDSVAAIDNQEVFGV